MNSENHLHEIWQPKKGAAGASLNNPPQEITASNIPIGFRQLKLTPESAAYLKNIDIPTAQFEPLHLENLFSREEILKTIEIIEDFRKISAYSNPDNDYRQGFNQGQKSGLYLAIIFLKQLLNEKGPT